MRVPTAMTRCVGLVCDADRAPGGTAFFLSVPFETEPNRFFCYLVTAGHNIDRALESGKVYLRANGRGGKAKLIDITNLEWLTHDDAGVDIKVSARPFHLPPNEWDYKFIGTDHILTNEQYANLGVGVGDELAIIGLFWPRAGKERNVPIVRSGIIAAMPDEPFEDEYSGLPL